jgi:uncharacterized protein
MLRNFWQAAGAVFVAVAVVGLFLAMKSPSSADGRAMVLPVDPQPLIIETKQGRRSFTIEIAENPAERERGLMFREDMDADHGMLFVFDAQQELGFWMKNTPMPLDLIFISENGTVRAIKKGEPFSEALISPGEPVRFVLELKAGTAAKNGIARGDKVRHRAIDRE